MQTKKQIEIPPLGKMIRDFRKQKGMSQEELARLAYFSRSALSAIELGEQECSDRILRDLKIALDISGLPLRDTDRPEFEEMLYDWFNAINKRDNDEAKRLRTRLVIIKQLPHDTELNNLFSLFDCRLYLNLIELDAAKEILDDLEARSDELSDMMLYHHFYNQGTYYVRTEQHELAVKYYQKAYELTKLGFEKNIILYYNLALCYDRLGYTGRAIVLLEEALKVNIFTGSNFLKLNICSLLGACYTTVKNLQRAKELLDEAHAIAKSDHSANANETNKGRLGLVLLNKGYMYRTAQKWNKAIDCLNDAAQHIEKEEIRYLELLYQKARCLIEMNNPQSSTSILNEGVKLSKGNGVYTAMFKTLGLMKDLDDKDAEQIETEILPYLLENNAPAPALDFATALSDYYKTKRHMKVRALEMSDIAHTILRKMREGGVIE